MTAKIIKRFGTDLALAAAKNIGSEIGKVPFTKNKKFDRKLSNLEKTKTILDLATKEYDLNNVNDNLEYVAMYTKKLIPVAGVTLGAYFVLPTIAAATAFAAVGTTISASVYTYSNFIVLAGGIYKACGEILETTQANNDRKW